MSRCGRTTTYTVGGARLEERVNALTLARAVALGSVLALMAAAIDPLRRKIDRYELTLTINPWHFFPTFVELVRQQVDGGAAVGTRTRSPRAPGWATAPSGLFISQVTTMDIRDVLPWSCSGRGRAERSRSTGAVASINPGRPGPVVDPGAAFSPWGADVVTTCSQPRRGRARSRPAVAPSVEEIAPAGMGSPVQDVLADLARGDRQERIDEDPGHRRLVRGEMIAVLWAAR